MKTPIPVPFAVKGLHWSAARNSIILHEEIKRYMKQGDSGRGGVVLSSCCLILLAFSEISRNIPGFLNHY